LPAEEQPVAMLHIVRRTERIYMSWVERQSDTGMDITVTPEKARKFEEAKAAGLPVVEREAAKGQMPFDPVRFTPVRSPGIYEAEFAKKDGDLIFHFWPYGYHEADRQNRRTPKFGPTFEAQLRQVMCSHFSTRSIEFHHDQDMGAWYVKIQHWGEKQFFHDLAVKACEKLHYALGGS
jgi:hypothetical protein